MVSICIPVYGVEKYIERCAKSLFEQTYSNIEYIFVDDCSKDNSINILKEVIAEYINKEFQIHILKHTINRGLAAARNTAVNFAKGDFIMHVDSDDYLEPSAVEELVKFHEDTQADYISFEAISYYPRYKKRIYHKDFRSSRDLAIAIVEGSQNSYIWCRFIKRELYIKNNIYAKEGINMGEDLQVSPILAYYSRKVAAYHKPIYHYECRNILSYTKTYSKDKEQQKDISRRIILDFFKDKGNDFMIAYDKASVKRLIQRIIEACSIDNKELFLTCANEKNDIKREYLHLIPLHRRLVFYINNYYIARLYVLLATKSFEFIKIVKSILN